LDKYKNALKFLNEYKNVEYFNLNYKNEMDALHLHGNVNKDDVFKIDLKQFLNLLYDVYKLTQDINKGNNYFKNNVKVSTFWKRYKRLKKIRLILHDAGFDSKPLGYFFATFEKNIQNLYCEFLSYKAKSNALNNVNDAVLSDALFFLRLSKLDE